MKYKLGTLLLGLCLLSASGPATAKKGDVAPGGSNDVLVELHKTGDKVDFKVTSKQPLKRLSLRWVQNPRRLRLSIPGAHLVSSSGCVAIDKGILQWAEAQANGEGVTLDLATISNPKSKISAAGDLKTLSWSASCIDIAGGDQVPSLPSSVAGGEAAAPEAHLKKPVAAKPAAPKPVAVEKPAAPEKPVAEKPAAPVAKTGPKPAPKQVASVPKEPPAKPTQTRDGLRVRNANPANTTLKPGDKLVSLNANGDLRASLMTLATAAGLKADIDPNVRGTVTMSFQNVPLNKAVSSILGQQSTFYEYKITDKVLRVSSPDGAGGQSVTPSTQTAISGRSSSEYFPIKDKKAVDILDAARKAVPGLTYTLDERLNQIIAEGEPSDLERLRKLLQKISVK